MLLDTNALAPNSPSIPTGLAVAIISAYVMHGAKLLKQFPKINFYSTKLNLALRAGISAVGTIGISLKWAAATGGGGVLAIAFPSATVLFAGLWHWAAQFGTQHLSESVLQILHQMSLIAKQATEDNK